MVQVQKDAEEWKRKCEEQQALVQELQGADGLHGSQIIIVVLGADLGADTTGQASDTLVLHSMALPSSH